MKRTIRFFDCFSGIGGFWCAANQIRSNKFTFKHVAYCEIDKHAQKFYELACASGDVQKICDVKTIKTGNNTSGIKVTDFDILFAGFPCQSFSNVGCRKVLDDPRGQ